MTIKNKQGQVYRLRGPNPIVKGQETWKKDDKLIFYNLRWEPITFAGLIEPPTKQTEVVEEVPVPRAIPQPVAVPEIKEPESNRKIKNVVVMHCLPASIRRTKDELYGDVQATVQYGKKFSFEGVIVLRTDLSMQFWTSIELTEGSVVYPSRYRDGVKFSEFRWWKVSSILEKAGGFLVEAVISNYQPDFSE